MSLTDGLCHFVASCLGRGYTLSEHKLLKLLQLRYMLPWWAAQETGQGLFTKPLCHLLCHLPIMVGEV